MLPQGCKKRLTILHYYVLGYYRMGKADDQWHSLKVKTSRPHAEVRARGGFYSLARRVPGDAPEEIERAVAYPFNLTALPVTVRVASSGAGAAAKRRVGLQVSVAAAAVELNEGEDASYEVVASAQNAAKDGGDRVRAHIEARLTRGMVERIRAQGLTHESVLQLAPGEYSVRVVVRDNLTGRLGSVTFPLTVSAGAAR